ncbi:uncharacterized protein E0L32_005025 [Thyridium curvatum]|uniref:Uncharacterized protein n=1 Tax=Thyridium curvatum TaxID=1093900 RepID=A0A507B707_9PEZI|nr:uncharacterized protein E0L32_005025 [Thyridium curvatum]TPX14916.1 hypothetical protein E0L32_005025 [Thyridium curvatum]
MDEPRSHAEEKQASQSTQTRKRQLDDNDAEPRTKRARLTRKNLAHFNKMGRKKTSDPSDDSGSTKTLSTTASGFGTQARKNGILDPISSKPPTNLEDIRERLARSRQTASPPESVYRQYARTVATAHSEATMVVKAGGKLLKEYDDDGYHQEFNQAFIGYPKDAGFNNRLSAPQPDFIEGLEMEEFQPFPVDDVSGAVLYKDDRRSVTLPHIAGEWKGRGKDMEEAALQSSYDGAALVYARNQALAYQGKSDPPGHANVTTFTTNGTLLNLYAHYAAPSAEDEDTLEYHQYPISTTDIKGTYQGHKNGRKELRNAQDYAKQQSYAMRDELKEHWKQNRNKLPPVAEGVHLPDVEPPPHATDGYEDASPHVLQEVEVEDEDDYEIVQPTTPRESSHHSKSSHRHHSSSQHSSKSHHHSSHHSSPHHSSKSSHHSSSHSSTHKRKASSSQTSSHGASAHASKHGSYWKKNSEGHYYHKHSDGTVQWYDDVKDHHRH